MMKLTIFQILGLQMTLLLTLSGQEFIPLWPEGKMPNSTGTVEDVLVNERFQQVGEPGMYAFFPSGDENNGSAVLVIPGGGYHHVTYNFSGLQLAKWFNTLGISAFVLKYRLPHQENLKIRYEAPLQDAERAMQLIRAHAEEWGIDKARIGALGTSAGGHLTAILGTGPDDVSQIGDSIGQETFAPNFLILVSPVITFGEYAHRGSLNNFLGPDASEELKKKYSAELQVTESTPISFLVHAANDPGVAPMNSFLFANALLAKGVSASLHLFPDGKHAIALRNNPGSTNMWTALCEAWLTENGFIRLITKK
ncbi:MAG: alpha/beta hydrolase [Saprospiraceae bacterium]|nr:alpha/beta hydrolase [Lewinella sp.]